MDLDIVSAQPNAADELTKIAMLAKGYWGYSEAFMRDCEDELRVTKTKLCAAEFAYVMAKQNTRTIGYYALQHISEGILELDALFVHPDFIGKGAGKALFRHALQNAAAQNAKRIDIQSDPNAEAFYLAMGARLVGHKASQSIPNRVLPLLSIEPGNQ